MQKHQPDQDLHGNWEDSDLARGDAFIGYQKDAPAAVVFQASNSLRRLREEDDKKVIHSKLEVLDRAGILENVPLNVLLDREDVTEL